MSEGTDKSNHYENQNTEEEEDDEEEEEEGNISYPLYIYLDAESKPVIEYVEEKKTEEINKKTELRSKEEASNTNNDATAIDTKNDEKKNGAHYIFFPEDYDAYVVKFYAPWCPHCQAYKPVYISIAKELTSRTTHEKVLFLAVSCVAHESICTTYNISGFPTIMGFKEDMKEGIILNNDDDPELSSDNIASRLHLDLIQGNGNSKQVSLFDDEYEKTDAPISLLRRNSNKLQKMLKLKKQAHEASMKQLHQHEYNKTLFDIYSDAGRSLIYLLRSNIYISNSNLSNERIETLKAWIDLLEWTLPEEWGMKYTFNELKKEFDVIVKSKKNLLSVVDKHKMQFYGIYDIPGGNNVKINNKRILNELSRFTNGCKHYDELSGYTCGLWHLFHIMTIGSSERYQTSYFDGYNVSTHHVGSTIYSFISNFFGCDVCRNNFKKMYNTCGYDHCKVLSKDDVPSSKNIARELPLWLWKVHNGVNVRLISERASRDGRNVTKEEEEAAIWPTKRMCPNCRNYNGEWNHTIVYDFLRWKYWPGYDHLSSQFTIHDVHYLSIYYSYQSLFLVFVLFVGTILIRLYVLNKFRSKKHTKVN